MIDDAERTPPILPKVTDGEFTSVTIERSEVHRLLQHLTPTKATGPDGIGARVPHECATELSPSLTSLFDLSFEQGTVPLAWSP